MKDLCGKVKHTFNGSWEKYRGWLDKRGSISITWQGPGFLDFQGSLLLFDLLLTSIRHSLSSLLQMALSQGCLEQSKSISATSSGLKSNKLS